MSLGVGRKDGKVKWQNSAFAANVGRLWQIPISTPTKMEQSVNYVRLV